MGKSKAKEKKTFKEFLKSKDINVSAKTYFVTPQNVDILGTQGEQPISDSQYF